MKKVYQKIIDKENGDCLRAVIASLLELEIENIPLMNGVLGTNQFLEMNDFLKTKGLKFSPISNISKEKDGIDFIDIAKYDGGINGYFYASVNSQTFEDIGHAVIVDSNMNIVHDPNPNQLALKLKPKDINCIFVTKEIIISKGKIWEYEEYFKQKN